MSLQQRGFSWTLRRIVSRRAAASLFWISSFRAVSSGLKRQVLKFPSAETRSRLQFLQKWFETAVIIPIVSPVFSLK